MDYTQKAADATYSQVQKQNNDVGAGEKQRKARLKEEAEDAMRARLRQVKDSKQK